MKTFDVVHLDGVRLRRDLQDFRRLLAQKQSLKEATDILPFFRKRPQLAAFCGRYNSKLSNPDLLAHEYDLFGDFSCDLVVGDSRKKMYTFIEFEDAGPKSLFVKQGEKATREWSREWSPRLDHGYGQIIDWFYKLADRENSEDYEARFGKRSVEVAGVLVIGRDHHMNTGERMRFEWRRRNVAVATRRIECVTFDELLADLQDFLETMDELSSHS
jgi:hypothetical protein